MQSPWIISRPDPITQAEQFSGNKPIARCNLRAAGDYLSQTFFFFFLVRCLNFATVPFFSQRIKQRGKRYYLSHSRREGINSWPGCSIGFFFCRGQRGETRDPTAAPTKHPSPFLPPRHPRSPSLQHCSGITHCTKPPVSSGWGVPKCHLGTGAGIQLELLSSLCFQGGRSHPCPEPFCDQLCLAGGLGNPSWLWGEAGTALLGPPPAQNAPLLLCHGAGWEGCTQA